MYIDHIHFYVESATKWRDWFIRVMDFQSIASRINLHTQTEIVSNCRQKSTDQKIVFLLSSPLNSLSPVAEFLKQYPEGVVDVALQVEDLESLVRGIKQDIFIQENFYPSGKLKTCEVTSIANLKHTLIERHGNTPILDDVNLVTYPINEQSQSNITEIDHLVLNVFQGNLESTANWYEQNLGFIKKQTFTIQTERSSLYSQVLVHPKTQIQFPINEPRSDNSQIQEFLDFNGKEGIQHLALKSQNILSLTKQLRDRGVIFLSVPTSYYQQINKQKSAFIVSDQEWLAIREQEILIDFEQDNCTSSEKPTLLQIFTKPIFDKPTFFFELIERRNSAQGFGEGNFQALFEAIEREQLQRGTFDEDKKIPR
jgi:4-hydroxyphenylpyruvate dioxygenase